MFLNRRISQEFEKVVIMTIKTIVLSAFVAGLIVATGSPSAHAQDASKVDLANLTCRAYLKLDNDEEEYTTIFFHGMISGKKNEMTADLDKMSKASEAVVDHCISNPDATLLSAFEKARK